MQKIILDTNPLTLEKAILCCEEIPIEVHPSLIDKVHKNRKIVLEFSQGEKPFYGINTGFGFLANQKIEKSDLLALQKNILMSHAAGWGEALDVKQTRLSMILRLNVLIKGYTGVSWELCDKLLEFINAGIYPIIPKYGSVGASGDLAPLAHLALPLIGEGEVRYKNERMHAMEALKKSNIKPIILKEKEGLSLINGTQIMLSLGTISLYQALRLVNKAEKITALTYEALKGHLQPLNPLLNELRNQLGQIESAKLILKELESSYLFDSTLIRKRVQDPYSLRCAPQVHGASRDALYYAKSIIERELNAITDNPLVFTENREIVSGGNFHGQPLAIALDFAAIALSEIANISERRLELLLNPNMSDQPAFLATRLGVDSGYMALQYLAASLVNENKVLSHPASTDSIPGNVGIEDHVSMGMTSARKFATIVENVTTVLACEFLAATQAIDLNKKEIRLGKRTQKSYELLRTFVPSWKEDRILSNDINGAREVLNKLEIEELL